MNVIVSEKLFPSIKLNSNNKIPLLGLGTYLIDSKQINKTIKLAIKYGYRHIDTASGYKNEEEIGNTLQELFKEGVIKREDIFLTSKLSPLEHGYEEAFQAYENSCKRLKVNYLDLYLIHWPGVGKLDKNSLENRNIRKQTWKAFEELYKHGKVKSIGVSNYTISHLKQLLEYCTIIPAVNQVELHPQLTQLELRNFCIDHDIQVEAYSSLGRGKLLNHPTVLLIANEHKKTPSQILLRWAIQQNIPVIPKTIKESRIIENSQIFNFSLSDSQLNTLNQMNINYRYCWDPTEIP
jgi:diketogulonate reductase-like aldo/keto reductase